VTRAVFSVDLFNEGVDVPLVDTLLLLRPTDSHTLFLQQLGRGLRRHPNKDFGIRPVHIFTPGRLNRLKHQRTAPRKDLSAQTNYMKINKIPNGL